MGVKGLWELLAPVGRRVSVETLAGKRLAIDASIWMVQFMKAMRDDKGEMVRNAHLLGFFRRICKLLFLRTKPIFVFDGGTPALKRRTVIARRRQRENAQAKVRKTAEKLLLNHLKTLKLKELADNIRNQRLKQKSGAKGGKKSNHKDLVGSDLGRDNVNGLDRVSGAEFASELDKNLSQTTESTRYSQEELDAMLAESIAAEENGSLASKMASSAVNLSEEEDDTDVEMILPALNDEVDPSVLAALPQSMQHSILSQLKGNKTGLLKDPDNQKQSEVNENSKGKGILLHEVDSMGCSSRNNDVTQNMVDEMLAASIAAEENEKLVNSASTSVGAFISEEEDNVYDDDEEMILPAMHGKVDPAILASLPPSMQLDLLVQMRERLIAENRQKYQKVKKDPAKFSELQIQAYLKTVAFRREIDGVQKAAAGGGVDGVQTSRIASEANREYIFSTSFTGDKQELTSTRLEKNKDTLQKTPPGNHPSQGFLNRPEPANDSSTSSGLICNKAVGASDESIETYQDERGHFRVSRLRAMGMRMTRDIQRNLDLMKEIEQERIDANKATNNNTVPNGDKTIAPTNSSNQSTGIPERINVDLVGEDLRNEHSVLAGDASMEISFVDDKHLDGDDDFFASLVAGETGIISYAGNSSSKGRVSDSNADSDWEEGIVEGNNNVSSGDVKVETSPSIAKDDSGEGSDVEWEEGVCDGSKSTLVSTAEPGQLTSRGHLEEEADLQEAIKRSLEFIGDQKHNCASPIYEHSNADKVKSGNGLNQDGNLAGSSVKDIYDNIGVPNGNNSIGGSTLQREDDTEESESCYKIIDGKLDNTPRNKLQTSQSLGRLPESSVAFDSEKMGSSFMNKPCRMDIESHSEDMLFDGNERMEDGVHVAGEQLGTFNEDSKGSTSFKRCVTIDSLGNSEEGKKNCNNEAKPLGSSSDIFKPFDPFVELSSEGLTEDINAQQEITREDNHGGFEESQTSKVKNVTEAPCRLSTKGLNSQTELPRENNHESFEERESNLGRDAMKDQGHLSADAVEVNLEEEIRILGQEYITLENEQRKLERNAESVNNELFTECQELLQMFGLPYIIAPMEAEAQCAYLELAKLVDGVVTDDSDVLLFGARSVYKNIFDDRKYVETYFMEDIEKELGLSREKLMRMALLLGSDYTEGVSGIGIVNAIEVVNAFPEEDGLLKFRQWVESPDPTIFGKFDTKSGSSVRKRGSKREENVIGTKSNIEETIVEQNTSPTHEQEESSDYVQEMKQIFMDKHRNVSKNWHIPSSFPSETVISAYCCPQVDKSTDSFTWGKPDHLVLRKLCWEKFGWTSQKADELLLPVLKEYNKKETQLRLEAFYTFNERFAKIRSKRIKKAVKGITGNQPSECIDGSAEDLSESRKNGLGIPDEVEVNRSGTLNGTEGSLANVKQLNLKQSRKRKNSRDIAAKTQSRKTGKLRGPTLVPPGLSKVNVQREVSSGSGGNRSGSSRGRGVGDQRSVKGSLGIDSCETSSSEHDSFDYEHNAHGKESEGPLEVRRSKRSRKIVNYAMGDIGSEDIDHSVDQSNETAVNEELHDELLSHLHTACGSVTTISRNEESMINLSPKDVSRNYLESGGGFCSNEDETSSPGGCNHDRFVNADYLKAAGGFCVDDDERSGDHNDIHDSTAIVEDIADLTHGSGSVDEVNYDKNSVDLLGSDDKRYGIEQDRRIHKLELNHNNISTRSNDDQAQSDTVALIPENAHGDSENSKAAFNAMPFLRKKRRRS